MKMKSFKQYLKESPAYANLPNINVFPFPEFNISKFIEEISILNKNIKIYTFIDANNYLTYVFLDNNLVVVNIKIYTYETTNMIVFIWQHKKYQNFARTIMFEYLLPKYKTLCTDSFITHQGKNAIIDVYKNIDKYHCECWIYDGTQKIKYKVINLQQLYDAWKGDKNEQKIIYFTQK